ncbi:MAG: alpha/beta fold hydrolase [Planctomycetes bacterium]|nr:alpha/beta fold hydrolase [Planctomycetota bacterium]
MGAMPDYEEITVSLPDGYRAHALFWSPPDPRGAVLYHHGIQSHGGWYTASAARLADAGYAVLQVDRRGSGRNERDRGHAESAEQLIADAVAARDELLRRSGAAAYHVVGVSWGGKLAVAVHLAAPDAVRSLSLVTPGIFPLIGVSRAEMARIGFAMLYEPKKLFDIPLNDAELFTAVPHWQAFFRTDARTLRRCTAGFYLASRRMDKPIAKFAAASAVPLHLLLAGHERIIDNPKTAAFVRGLEWPDCRITTYDAARHSLEFEDDPEIYFRDLISFIKLHD